MPSLIQGFEYDVFISYRQNDNRSGWVTEFVQNLKEELSSTIKEPVSVYFDENPHDGLLETHRVDKSLEGKLKCLIFIPVLSHTYCDSKSFAWNKEFLAFCHLARTDAVGPDVQLDNGNVTGRILPVQIHDLDDRDQALFEKQSCGPLRSIDFIFGSQGVNRPLTLQDVRGDNVHKTFYRDQINKTANAIKEIVQALEAEGTHPPQKPTPEAVPPAASTVKGIPWIWKELLRRNVFRAGFVYLVIGLLLHQFLVYLTPMLKIEERFVNLGTRVILFGLPLAILFAWFFEVSPLGIIRTSSQASSDNPYPPYRKKPLTGKPLISILVIALLSQYIYFSYMRPPVIPPPINLLGNKIISIAVLPFENRGGERSDAYIADGITDDIINRLTIISQLRVTNRGKILQYQGEMLPYSDIANDLQVMTLLIGSVQRSGKQIVVRAQLIDGKTSSFIWGNTFQRTSDNIMAVQSEIAQVIADLLKITLNDLEKVRLNLKPTNNSTAYDYYLRGRSFYYKYKPAANDSAVEQFKMAIALDPKYARAWAGLGDAYSQMNSRFSRSESWLDSSLAAGYMAIKLDSNLSDAYKALANAYSYKKLYSRAFPLLVKSVELNPTNDQAVGNLGTNYLLRGDLPTALRWEKRGVGMNPKNWIPYQLIGWIYRLLGDLKEAESWFLKSLEINPGVFDTYELLAYAYVTEGRKEEALRLISSVLEIGKDDSRSLEVAGLIAHFVGDSKRAKEYFQRSIDNNPSYKDDHNTLSPIGLGQILLQEGKRVEAEVYLSHAMEIQQDEINKGSQSPGPPFYVAGIYAIRGNREQSLTWLQKAIDTNWMDYVQVTHGPWFSRFKTDPAFIEKVDVVRKKTEEMRANIHRD